MPEEAPPQPTTGLGQELKKSTIDSLSAHVFPKCKFQELPSSKIINAATFLFRRTIEESFLLKAYNKARKADLGFAHRIDLPSTLNQEWLTFELRNGKPSLKPITKDVIGDLLNPDEELAGVCERPLSSLGYDSDESIIIIGIVGPNGEPKGLVWHRPGERPRRGQKAREILEILKELVIQRKLWQKRIRPDEPTITLPRRQNTSPWD